MVPIIVKEGREALKGEACSGSNLSIPPNGKSLPQPHIMRQNAATASPGGHPYVHREFPQRIDNIFHHPFPHGHCQITFECCLDRSPIDPCTDSIARVRHDSPAPQILWRCDANGILRERTPHPNSQMPKVALELDWMYA
jgi:hypothetical protein